LCNAVVLRLSVRDGLLEQGAVCVVNRWTRLIAGIIAMMAIAEFRDDIRVASFVVLRGDSLGSSIQSWQSQAIEKSDALSNSAG
jgi:hypothetical protein